MTPAENVGISFGSWAFSFGPYAKSPVSFADTAKRLASTGYDGIEIGGFPPHVTLTDYPNGESRRAVRRLLEDLNLGVSGYAADLSSVNPVTPGNAPKYLDLFGRQLEMCVDLGSPSLRVDTVAAPFSVPEKDMDAALNRVAGIWNQAAAQAQQAGVRLVWEFEPGFLFNKPSEILGLHQAVAHPNFFILFDTSHAYMCAARGARQREPVEVLNGGAAELLAKLKGRIGAIHLIDSDGTLYADETSSHVPFGEGRIDFSILAPKLRQIPHIEWWTVDLCFLAGAWDLIESSRRFVATLLER